MRGYPRWLRWHPAKIAQRCRGFEFYVEEAAVPVAWTLPSEPMLNLVNMVQLKAGDIVRIRDTLKNQETCSQVIAASELDFDADSGS